MPVARPPAAGLGGISLLLALLLGSPAAALAGGKRPGGGAGEGAKLQRARGSWGWWLTRAIHAPTTGTGSWGRLPQIRG